LHEKYKDLLDWFFILDHCKTIWNNLNDHLNKELHQQVSMEVTKKMTDIIEDVELQKKLACIDVDDEFNKQVSKETLKRYHNMEK
jgi:hypothetical protein